MCVNVNPVGPSWEAIKCYLQIYITAVVVQVGMKHSLVTFDSPLAVIL